jgi:3-phenylpropionate/cinnamic acid dioxygenase small subunit
MSRQAAHDLVLHESRLSEESRLQEWLELWDPDGLYWIPIGDPVDPHERTVAIVRDTLAELRERVARLESGLVHSQIPPSRWSRVWGPLDIRPVDEGSVPAENRSKATWEAVGNFHIVEMRRGQRKDWAGRAEYLFSTPEGSTNLRLLRKTVWLVDRDVALPPLMFLI